MESYLKEVNKINGNDKLSVIGIFTTHYGDAAVARALVVAQKKATTHDAANTIKQLRSEQLSAWMKSEKTVDDVFELLKLRQNGYKALGSPKLEVLDDYMKMVIQKTSGKQTLLQTLTNGFEGEEKLAALLVRAKEDTSTSELATALQNALMNKWIETDKLKPENVFSKLRLDRGVDALLDRNEQTLAAFISMYNARNPDSRASSIGMFVAQYGDNAVAETLVLARSESALEPLARNLQQQQFHEWQKSKKSADDVFKLMNIEEKDFSHIISPKLEIVKGYIMLLKATNPEDTTDLLSVVSNGFKGDGALAQAIVKKLAMLHSRNPVAAVASTAAEFEMLLFRRWFKSKIDPVSFYRQVFGVEEANAGRWQKAVVRRYTEYYSDKNAGTRVSHTVNIIPRRS
ncbi:WD repeat-containing protein 7 [Phytophthora nicotianae]|nr:WD repeat-containing protein 7 [Phytophthora nicotianae]